MKTKSFIIASLLLICIGCASQQEVKSLNQRVTKLEAGPFNELVIQTNFTTVPQTNWIRLDNGFGWRVPNMGAVPQ